MRFRKAHGTGNDFVVIGDAAGDLSLTPRFVAALCDRRRGVGGDGILRAVRVDRAGEDLPGTAGCEFFMDYRNADGSLAEMCGNGARVFAQYLWDAGLAEGGEVTFATRGGARTARRTDDGLIEVEMGAAVLGEAEGVAVTAAGTEWPATAVHVPNPHAVAFVPDLAVAGDLLQAPDYRPASAFPDGVNVEFVVPLSADEVAMRVHERGSGETLSCGTGACAVAVVHAARSGGPGNGRRIRVDVPGGTLSVMVRPDGTVALRGPAQTVAEGELDSAWLAAAMAGRS